MDFYPTRRHDQFRNGTGRPALFRAITLAAKSADRPAYPTLPGSSFSRMLKKCQLALLVETKARLHVSAYARNRRPAEFDVQLPVTGRARTSEPSVAADSVDGR